MKSVLIKSPKLLFMALLCHFQSHAKISDLIGDYESLNLPGIQLGFASVRDFNSSTKQWKSQLSRVDKLLEQTSELLKSPGQSCEQMALEGMQWNLKLEKERIHLLMEEQGSPQAYNGSVFQLPNKDRWYRWLVQQWLGVNVTPQELIKIGEQEFAKAHKQLLQIKREEDDLHVPSKNTDKIEAAYKQSEQTIRKNLNQLFPENWSYSVPGIELSSYGKRFPAPGYYTPANDTFYYNPQDEAYNLSQVDWLYLHEAIPGHHYQNKMSDAHGVCRGQTLSTNAMAFTEGWAAYVETLGQELGVLKSANERYFALKWESLRAMRVIIDVGIHTQGWSVQQAQDYWLKHFPEGEDVMQREIGRIQTWPVQVHTYVYGKHIIESLKALQKNKLKDQFDVIAFHKELLSLGNLPLRNIQKHYKN